MARLPDTPFVIPVVFPPQPWKNRNFYRTHGMEPMAARMRGSFP